MTPAAVLVVKGASPVPSAPTRQMLMTLFKFTSSVPSSLREDRKTTRDAAGDQTPKRLSAVAVVLVSGVSPVPSAWMLHRLKAVFVFGASVPSSLRVDER